ncbi:MAG: GDSL-type esterase/lipase family protein [Ignavibacterium album]|uniref:GDSL-type esterase/lipase family protein n=1 Tax=Ignavibacterium album TaxID=591197 RepID=UPI0026EC995B|nr:GDSL-type esterase/lipase family protein [Ignavibacterium album]MCX8104588.1 GDSL-type esterase/lipase family protein [Ignavibacterium album]
MKKKILKENNSIKTESKSKKPPKWFYLVLVLIPVLFFVLLEIGLRIFKYGYDFTVFKVVTDYHADKLFLNPEIPYKYFYGTRSVPSALPDGFDKDKKPNAFRVFVLGGSSTAGWPYVPNASFPRQLKRKLELLYPQNNIEVINLGISAINSYTLRDFIPAILDQKPDLILIYAGHNEYYGALGVGSTVSIGSSRNLVNLYLWLYNFKTTQLLRDFISWVYGIFKDTEKATEASNETLMSQMIGNSLIAYDSDEYWAGIKQFEGNLDDIIEMIRDKNVPVIIGKLTSNLREQKPFVSIKTEKYPAAEEVFIKANEELEKGNIEEARKLFFLAKEYDALRFRAPQKINEVISEIGNKFKVPVVDIDSVFRKLSPYELVGYNLTVDHLHPNIDGYRLIADTFYDEMKKRNLLPKGQRADLSEEKADSILKANFPFTALDSTLANFSIIVLTGQYPFVPKGTPNYKMLNYKMSSIVDTIAAQIFNKQLKWETAHSKLAEYYLNRNEIDKFIKEMEAIIAERPYYDVPYRTLAAYLIDKGYIERAIPYLKKLDEIKSDFFSNKWLGQVYLKLNKAETALPYLQKAVQFGEADYQLWYNLAGAYYLNGNVDLAITSIERSLQLNPKNPLAINFYNQIKSLGNKN